MFGLVLFQFISFISMIVGLLAGVISLIEFSIKIPKKFKLLTALLFLLVPFILLIVIITNHPKYLNEELTIAAWNAFNKKDYQSSLEKAKECIIEFKTDAKLEENKFIENNIPEPPIGKVGPEEKKEILRRGLLNDVATCWYIIGKCEWKLNNLNKAISAFDSATVFQNARIYDPASDAFWSPAQKAQSYINAIKSDLY